MKAEQVIKHLKSEGNPANLAGMARYGISINNALGISMPVLRQYARQFKGNHELALELWASGIHEARIMASIIDDPKKVTKAQMENWVKDFNSWDICDQTCGNLFNKTDFAFDVAFKWCKAKEEFVKRAGFAMIVAISVHGKKVTDEKLIPFFDCIIEGSTDDRNFVKKAVNWALRTLGKRSKNLYPIAIATAEKIQKADSRSAKWIAADALRELRARE